MWPVMLTPFKEDYSIDWYGLDALTDWYMKNNADGLFSVCLSSEMYHLNEEERIKIASRAVSRCNGLIPVAATGTFGGNIEHQIESIKFMADAGVSIVVINAAEIAHESDSNELWLENIHHLISHTEGIRLGIYECPVPYHRLLSQKMVEEIASTNRFFYFKDTSCSIVSLQAKINAANNSNIIYTNANAPTLLDSLKLGGGGYSGIGANLLPWHYAWLCHNFTAYAEEAHKLQRFLSIADMAVRNKYPTSAKIFLSMQGLPIKPICRTQDCTFSEEELLILEHLNEAANDIKNNMLSV